MNMEQNNWKKKLSPEQYRIMRENGTEAPFEGKYTEIHEKGMFTCAACNAELFYSDTKFDSHTGWPSFPDPANLKNIELKEDTSHGMQRTEILCSHCGSHLGHLFDDGPDGEKRYCVNSICLNFKKNS